MLFRSINQQNYVTLPSLDTEKNKGMVIYPSLLTRYGLCLNSNYVQDYLTINPGEEIIVPLYCEYKVTKDSDSISKIMSFDLRTSLYKDPINYTFKVIAKYANSEQDYLQIKNKKRLWERLTDSLKYNQTVK